MALIYGKAFWASISTPNTKFEPQWSVDVEPADSEDLERLKAAGHKIKTSPEGVERVTFKRKCESANGKSNKQPKLVDAHKNPIDIQVGNGSDICVQYNEYSGKNKYGPYQGLDLQAVQVIDLVEYAGADGAEFESFDPDSEL
jgi:hypothetical protein